MGGIPSFFFAILFAPNAIFLYLCPRFDDDIPALMAIFAGLSRKKSSRIWTWIETILKGKP